jgi:hypothetical protein
MPSTKIGLYEMRKLVLWIILLMVSALVATAHPASARGRALLIGVSDYDNPAIAHLRGPRNDVTIMWRLIKNAGFMDEDIVVLADGVPANGHYPKVRARPTRAAILDAFSDLAKQVGKDDFVYVHISSHGSEQPVQPGGGPQPGNRNQVMLPIDVGVSTDGRTIPNGIPDFELGKALDVVRAKAGRVWIVIDMCHAGTATRGDLVTRYVDPSDLNIAFPPQAVRDSAARGSGAPTPFVNFDPAADAQAGVAPMVAFFAVGPTESSFEKSFPGYDSPLIGNDRLGVFTYLVNRALQSARSNKTYRDLRNVIVGELNSGAAGVGMPLPMFEGDLDAPVFGANGFNVPKGWPGRYHDNVLDISAGTVQGLQLGSAVAVHKGASDQSQQIGRATVEAAQPATSRAKLETVSGIQPLAQNEDVWVTMVEEAASFVYFISEPPVDDRNAENAAVGFAAIAKIKHEKVNKEGIAAEWRPAGSERADFRLRVKDGSIWITQASGVLMTDPSSPYSSPRVRITDVQETADKPFDALWSLARAQNIVRLASVYPVGNLVSITGERYTPEKSSAKPDETTPEWKRDCPSNEFYASLLQRPGIPLRANDIPELTQCDMVVIKLRNQSRNFVDAVVLYVDARGGIQRIPALPMVSGSDECSLELPPRATEPILAPEKIVLWEKGKPATAGAEYIVVIAAERPAAGAQTCFRSLTQPTLEGARKAELVSTRGPESALQSLLNNAALAQPATRGGSAIQVSRLVASTMSLYTLHVSPNPRRVMP